MLLGDPGESKWVDEDLNRNFFGNAVRHRKGPDLCRCSTRIEPNFPDGNGCHARSYELQGFSVSLDVVLEHNLTAVDGIGLFGYARGNVKDGYVGGDGAIEIGLTNSNHLSIR